MHVRKQQLKLDMEQQTGSKYEKEYVKAGNTGVLTRQLYGVNFNSDSGCVGFLKCTFLCRFSVSTFLYRFSEMVF